MPGQAPDPRQNLDPDVSPRAQLGAHLKRLRTAAGFTSQAAAAASIDGFGQDSVQKAETGAQVPSKELFDKLLDLYGATDVDRQYLDPLFKLARVDRDTTSAVPDFAKPWYEAETIAEFLRLWAIWLVPGLLQTVDYARLLFDELGITQDKVDELVDVLKRRQSLLEGPDPVQLVAVLHEAVLYHLIGSPQVMVAQLTHLLEMSARLNITIQVIRGPGAYPALTGAFEIATTHGEPDTVMMQAIEDETKIAPALTRKAAILFERVRRSALSVEETRAVIMEAKEHWESQH
jgi:transcriptional regulator with XRE-family HTH domain